MLKADFDNLILQETQNDQVDLWNKQIDDDSIKLLFNTKSNASKLHLGCNSITCEGLIFFSRPNWINLIYLSLCANQIGSKGCKYLSRANLKQVKQMNLGNNSIGSAGIIHISKSKWGALQRLYLNNNQISMDSVPNLIRTDIHKIMALLIPWNKLTEQQLYLLLISEFNNVTQIALRSDLVSKILTLQKLMRLKRPCRIY